MEKVAQLFGGTLVFSQKLPKENSQPTGENSPNLVTLMVNKPEVSSVENEEKN
jgi:hypothetical protein